MAKTWAIIFGIILVVISIVGFISNPLIGPAAYFVSDATHNIVYLLLGIILLIAAGAGEQVSALWLKIIGFVYILLFIDGLIPSQTTSLLGFVGSNRAHAYLHLVLGILILIAGFMGGKKKMDANPVM